MAGDRRLDIAEIGRKDSFCTVIGPHTVFYSLCKRRNNLEIEAIFARPKSAPRPKPSKTSLQPNKSTHSTANLGEHRWLLASIGTVSALVLIAAAVFLAKHIELREASSPTMIESGTTEQVELGGQTSAQPAAMIAENNLTNLFNSQFSETAEPNWWQFPSENLLGLLPFERAHSVSGATQPFENVAFSWGALPIPDALSASTKSTFDPSLTEREPNEHQMYYAFKSSLDARVLNVITLLSGSSETFDERLAKRASEAEIRVRHLTKSNCSTTGTQPGYVCSFTVALTVMNSQLQSKMSGRFIPTGQHYIFVQNWKYRNPLVEAKIGSLNLKETYDAVSENWTNPAGGYLVYHW